VTDDITYRCPECGSTDIYAGAEVIWNTLGQCWELANGFNPEELACERCGHETDIAYFRPAPPPTEPPPPAMVPFEQYQEAIKRAEIAEAKLITVSIKDKCVGRSPEMEAHAKALKAVLERLRNGIRDALVAAEEALGEGNTEGEDTHERTETDGAARRG